jgi:SRSO17 transposase
LRRRRLLQRGPLRTAKWDVDGVRDDLRGYVLDGVGDPASGVFVVDESGFVKKGTRSAGVAHQYTGTTGEIDNCQVGVFLAYASSRGRALVDRELYLPTSWTEDPDRCAAAGIPTEVGFATKPQLGIAMRTRARRAGLLEGESGSTAWVTADELYGQNPTFRGWLVDHEIPFVLAIRNDDMLTSPDGHRRQAKILATIAGARPRHRPQRLGTAFDRRRRTRRTRLRLDDRRPGHGGAAGRVGTRAAGPPPDRTPRGQDGA